ncbi:hypothetical protein J9978_21340 [Chromobacterium violaceum]|uniref:hypothetical protein n=1 Tax=Chromobacterium violaceum TaxID=536 RepID=UPI0015943B87|nr:hypothetical protein [Chromobacterium violaceum]MBP4052025.1 hypothetical protein [Chromobacterium violaceum]
MTPRGIEEAGKTSLARAGFLISHRQGGRNFHSVWKTAEPTDIEARRNHPADERAAVRARERRERRFDAKKAKGQLFRTGLLLMILAGGTGLEPVTLGIKIRCSTN